MIFQQVCKEGKTTIAYINDINQNTEKEKAKVKSKLEDTTNVQNVGTSLRCGKRRSAIT